MIDPLRDIIIHPCSSCVNPRPHLHPHRVPFWSPSNRNQLVWRLQRVPRFLEGSFFPSRQRLLESPLFSFLFPSRSPSTLSRRKATVIFSQRPLLLLVQIIITLILLTRITSTATAAGQYLTENVNLKSSGRIDGGITSKPTTSRVLEAEGEVRLSEDLLAREKSLIRDIVTDVMKPVPRTIEVSQNRKEQSSYLTDLNLDFDSPFKSLSIDNCSLDFRSYYDSKSQGDSNSEATVLSSHASSELESPDLGVNISLQISGGFDCNFLPFHALSREEKETLTHLVIRDTGIQELSRFLLGRAQLGRLLRLDVIENHFLTTIQGLAFVGLNQLTYLSFIDNLHLQDVRLEAFLGAKRLEQLIFIGNGNHGKLFRSVLRATPSKVLPNLVHLYLKSRPIFSPSINSSSHSNQPYHDKGSSNFNSSLSSSSESERQRFNSSKEDHWKHLDSSISRFLNDSTAQLDPHLHSILYSSTDDEVSASDILTHSKGSRMQVSFALLSVITTILLLLLVALLVFAFVYESTLKNLFTMVEDDFLHNYTYDAFVSYSVNDAEWVFDKLIPNLEGFDAISSSSSSVSSCSSSSCSQSPSSNGIKLCVYDRDFIAGRAISECITDAIKNSRKVILVISKSFIQRLVFFLPSFLPSSFPLEVMSGKFC